MFQRRKKQTTFDQLHAVMFARKGWTRPFFYIWQRLKRRPGSPRRIAMGVAVGAGISFTPFIGLHLALGYLFSFLLGGDAAAMVIGSLIGNPWTFPLIWISSFFVGKALLRLNGNDAIMALDLERLSFSDVLDHPMDLLLPMTVGGLVIGGIVSVIVFYVVLKAVSTYQNRRSHKIKSRRSELNKRLQALLQESEK